MLLTSPALLQSLFGEGASRKQFPQLSVAVVPLCAFPPCPEPCFGALVLLSWLFFFFFFSLLAAGL